MKVKSTDIQNNTALKCAKNYAKRCIYFKDVGLWEIECTVCKNRVVDFISRWRHFVLYI